jgi:hypothetical protein
VNKCSVCVSSHHDSINSALATGVSLRRIEKQFGVSKSAVERHANGCAAELLRVARGDRAAASGGKLDAELASLAAETRSVLEAARESKDWGLALRAIARLEQQLSIRAKLEGDGGDGAVVNVAVQVNLAQSPEWAQLRAVILAALDTRSRLALADALEKGGY